MRKLVALAVLAALAGCGNPKNEKLPAACSEGYAAVLKALRQAPGPVVIDGVTPISRCFNRGASSDDAQIVGSTLLPAAQQLGDRARAGDTTAALRLGYLIGASERGSKRSGLGDEIVRRLQAVAAVGAARQAAYDRGHRAGRAGG